jgi:hypothetical protein
MAMLGQDQAASRGARQPSPMSGTEAQSPSPGGEQPQPRLPNPATILRGILGR